MKRFTSKPFCVNGLGKSINVQLQSFRKLGEQGATRRFNTVTRMLLWIRARLACLQRPTKGSQQCGTPSKSVLKAALEEPLEARRALQTSIAHFGTIQKGSLAVTFTAPCLDLPFYSPPRCNCIILFCLSLSLDVKPGLTNL